MGGTKRWYKSSIGASVEMEEQLVGVTEGFRLERHFESDICQRDGG